MFEFLKGGYKESNLGSSDYVRLSDGKASVYNSYFALEQPLTSAFHPDISCCVLGSRFFAVTSCSDENMKVKQKDGKLLIQTSSGKVSLATVPVESVPKIEWFEEHGAKDTMLEIKFDDLLHFCSKNFPNEILRSVYVKDGYAYTTDNVTLTRTESELPDCLLPYDVCKFFKNGMLAKVGLKNGATRFDFEDGSRMQSGQFAGKYPDIPSILEPMIREAHNIEPFMFQGNYADQMKRLGAVIDNKLLPIQLVDDTLVTCSEKGTAVETFDAQWPDVRVGFEQMNRALSRGLIYLRILSDGKCLFTNASEIDEASIVHVISNRV